MTNAWRIVLETNVRSALRTRVLVLALVWTALGVALALARRGEGADDVVIGGLGALVVPLVAFSIAAGVLASKGYRSTVEPLVRLGAPLRFAALAPFAVAAASSAIICALLGALTVALARSAASPASDVFTTTWIAALGGASYAIVFVAASAFGRNGIGRGVALAIDLVLGAGGGLGAALTLRGHLRNMLGGSAPLAIGQRASFVWLVVLAAIAVAIAVRRVAPRRAVLGRPRR